MWLTGLLAVCGGVAAAPGAGQPAAVVRVATYNVQNYLCMDRRLDGRFAPRYPKPEDQKTCMRAVIHRADADVLCLQEIGPRPFLDELQQDLAREGLGYPHAAFLDGPDSFRHVAVLSRVPFAEIIAHDDLTFDYLGRTEAVKRGLLEVRFAGPAGPWALFVVHLKSPLTEDRADPRADKRRAAEARAVRDRVMRQTSGEVALPFLIAGDMNATPDAPSLAGLRRRGDREIARLIPASDSRGETWTHFQLQSERYERLDYILASPDLAPCVVDGAGRIDDGADALQGSDHRLVRISLRFAAPPESNLDAKTPAGGQPAGVSP